MTAPERSRAAFFVACLIASFAYGVTCTHYHLFPCGVLVQAYEAAVDISTYWNSYIGRAPARWLRPSTRQGAGVTIHKAGLSEDGVTFVSSVFDNDVGLRLIDLDGRTLHSWPVRYRDLWSPQEQATLRLKPWRDWDAGLMGAAVLPDASVVFTFNNGGLVRLDKCGRVLWKHPYRTHHSIFVSEDSTLWIPGAKAPTPINRPTGLGVFVAPFIEDSILQIDSAGNILREISVPRLLLQNGLEAILLANGVTATINLTDDYTHLNKVAVLQSSDAAAFSMFKAGDVLVSLRNLNLIFVFDPQTERVKWYQIGPWLRQHDPQFTHDGMISVYDNHTDNDDGRRFGGSRIVTVEPASHVVRVVYAGSAGRPFYSDLEGEHVYLRNGNLLISESMTGRIFEVDKRGDIVWEFVNRYDERHLIAETHAYARLTPEYFQSVDWTCGASSGTKP
jgi:hypothetical protein